MANPQNVEISSHMGDLILRIKQDTRLGPSSTGKTIMVGSTHGAVPVTLDDGTTLYVSVNAYVYPPKVKRGTDLSRCTEGGGST